MDDDNHPSTKESRVGWVTEGMKNGNCYSEISIRHPLLKFFYTFLTTTVAIRRHMEFDRLVPLVKQLVMVNVKRDFAELLETPG